MVILKLLIATAAAIGSVTAQQTLDTTNNAAVLAACKAAMPALKQFFPDNNSGLGSWIETYTDKRGLIQWHETGIYWDFFYQYYGFTGDATYNDWVDLQMQLAVGPNVGFLDAMSATTGRWNDDIGWWGLAVLTAAESTKNGIIAPKNIIDGGNPKYIDVANNTYFQMYGDWDDSCGGGMFWSRNRHTKKINDAYYKSAITNAQHVEMGARLYVYTGGEMYKKIVDRVYNWMKTSMMIDPVTYAVYDGLDSQSCSLSPDMYSYHLGELIAGLSIMYKKTQDQTYLDEAHKFFAHVKSFFTVNNVLYDPLVGPTPSRPNGYLWPVYKSLGYLYAITPSQTVKSDISLIFAATAQFLFQSCDSNWYCIRNLDPNTDHTLWNGTSPRDQFDVVALLNALAMATTPTVQRVQDLTPNPDAQGGSGAGDGKNAASASAGASPALMYGGIAGGVALLILGAIVGVVIFRKQKQKKVEAAMGRRGGGGISKNDYYNGRGNGRENERDRRNDGYDSRQQERGGGGGGPRPSPGAPRKGQAGPPMRSPDPRNERSGSRGAPGNGARQQSQSRNGGRNGGGGGGPQRGNDRDRRNDGYDSDSYEKGRGGRGGGGGGRGNSRR
ncbi:glycosyl hydrolase family 76-domain-containing protein [Obelidium mucronatum]|nr:glycosyl hydrolase family 76-domain-containing protein [Obelidium mucronatum]